MPFCSRWHGWRSPTPFCACDLSFVTEKGTVAKTGENVFLAGVKFTAPKWTGCGQTESRGQGLCNCMGWLLHFWPIMMYQQLHDRNADKKLFGLGPFPTGTIAKEVEGGAGLGSTVSSSPSPSAPSEPDSSLSPPSSSSSETLSSASLPVGTGGPDHSSPSSSSSSLSSDTAAAALSSPGSFLFNSLCKSSCISSSPLDATESSSLDSSFFLYSSSFWRSSSSCLVLSFSLAICSNSAPKSRLAGFLKAEGRVEGTCAGVDLAFAFSIFFAFSFGSFSCLFFSFRSLTTSFDFLDSLPSLDFDFFATGGADFELNLLKGGGPGTTLALATAAAFPMGNETGQHGQEGWWTSFEMACRHHDWHGMKAIFPMTWYPQKAFMLTRFGFYKVHVDSRQKIHIFLDNGKSSWQQVSWLAKNCWGLLDFLMFPQSALFAPKRAKIRYRPLEDLGWKMTVFFWKSSQTCQAECTSPSMLAAGHWLAPGEEGGWSIWSSHSPKIHEDLCFGVRIKNEHVFYRINLVHVVALMTLGTDFSHDCSPSLSQTVRWVSNCWLHWRPVAR